MYLLELESTSYRGGPTKGICQNHGPNARQHHVVWASPEASLLTRVQHWVQVVLESFGLNWIENPDPTVRVHFRDRESLATARCVTVYREDLRVFIRDEVLLRSNTSEMNLDPQTVNEIAQKALLGRDSLELEEAINWVCDSAILETPAATELLLQHWHSKDFDKRFVSGIDSSSGQDEVSFHAVDDQDLLDQMIARHMTCVHPFVKGPHNTSLIRHKKLARKSFLQYLFSQPEKASHQPAIRSIQRVLKNRVKKNPQLVSCYRESEISGVVERCITGNQCHSLLDLQERIEEELTFGNKQRRKEVMERLRPLFQQQGATPPSPHSRDWVEAMLAKQLAKMPSWWSPAKKALELHDSLLSLEFPSPFEKLKGKGATNVEELPIRLRYSYEALQADRISVTGSDENFIAMPQPVDISNFWYLVFQEKAGRVVNLNGNISYLPPTQGDAYEVPKGAELTITVTGLQKLSPDHEVRTIHLVDTRTSEEHYLQHHTYKAWPDLGVPSQKSFKQFLKHLPVTTEPTVVHCTAGRGRTGTFLLGRMFQQLKNQGTSLWNLLQDLRSQRRGLVETEAQYCLAFHIGSGQNHKG